MDTKEKIALIRSILNNADNMNMRTEIILEISRKIDKYIVEYHRKNEDKASGKKVI
ncbi:MAG TPA: Spo0E family sporulation regulatory protein-aspartic acid phosphatase [Clostridiaceae bacterium]|nr:Spo0E family sporulation regulatory protein-aspartic acid phosphatase [Clostridiaceae bacterium]